jgi:hypothetical protein
VDALAWNDACLAVDVSASGETAISNCWPELRRWDLFFARQIAMRSATLGVIKMISHRSWGKKLAKI